jgi:hypothetical protein
VKFACSTVQRQVKIKKSAGTFFSMANAILPVAVSVEAVDFLEKTAK